MEEVEVGYKSTSIHLGVPVIWTEHIKLLPNGKNTSALNSFSTPYMAIDV